MAVLFYRKAEKGHSFAPPGARVAPEMYDPNNTDDVKDYTLTEKEQQALQTFAEACLYYVPALRSRGTDGFIADIAATFRIAELENPSRIDRIKNNPSALVGYTYPKMGASIIRLDTKITHLDNNMPWDTRTFLNALDKEAYKTEVDLKIFVPKKVVPEEKLNKKSPTEPEKTWKDKVERLPEQETGKSM